MHHRPAARNLENSVWTLTWATFVMLLWLGACSGETSPEVPPTSPSEVQHSEAPSSADGMPAVQMRLLAANTTSGGDQSYPDPGPGVRIFQALDADIVLIQEFQVDGSLDAWVERNFGPEFEHCIEAVNGLPNGVISRWPILECGEWIDPFMLNRDFPFARIDLPGERDLWAVSVHFKASSGSSNRDRRLNEGQEVVRRVTERVPDDDYLVIGGDFNTQNRTEPVLEALRQVVVVEAPFPDDGQGDGDTNSSRRKPYDWVLVDDDLSPFEVAVGVGGKQFDNGLVFDSRIFTQEQLDEHFPPVRQADSGADQMQHMAVVRDFVLGDPDPPGDDDPADPPGPVDPPGDDDDDPVDPPVDDDDPVDPPDGDDDDGDDGPAPMILDLSGYRIEQSGKSLDITLPEGTSLNAGASLVIGRQAKRGEFEGCWGPLPATTQYLVGSEIEAGPGSEGFPQINGGERYRVIDAEGRAVDPADGQAWPRSPMDRHSSVRRLRTITVDSTSSNDAASNVDAGSYAGQRDGIRKLILTEVSDAADFRCEFIELFFDAAPP